MAKVVQVSGVSAGGDVAQWVLENRQARTYLGTLVSSHGQRGPGVLAFSPPRWPPYTAYSPSRHPLRLLGGDEADSLLANTKMCYFFHM